jgi:hypothetical protein
VGNKVVEDTVAYQTWDGEEEKVSCSRTRTEVRKSSLKNKIRED